MTKKIKILVLIFTPTGRDPEAIIPLTWYLDKVFGYKIILGSIFDSRFLIDKIKPEILLLNNVEGSEFNVLAASYAYQKGIKVITLVSEGLYRKEIIDLFIWGNNTKKKINWHLMFVWSEVFLKYAKDFLPKYKERFDISGSTGIDRYKIYTFLDKSKFSLKYKKRKYKKIIIYGGFTFGKFFDDNEIKTYGYSKKYIDYHKNEMYQVKSILKELIEENRDILFILKKHPGESNDQMEIDSSWNYKNVLIFQNEEPLAELINCADICFIYRSSTSFEAYALNKPVINILRPEPIFYKQDDQKGNSVIKSTVEAQALINEFYKTGKIKDFDRKEKIRQKLIKDKIFSIDGLNSYRTAVKINFFLKKMKRVKIKKNYSVKGYLFHMLLSFNKILRFIPRIKKSAIINNYNNMKNFNNLKDNYYPQVEKFYSKKLTKYEKP